MGPDGDPVAGGVTFTPCSVLPGVVVNCPLTYTFDDVTGTFTTGDLFPGCYDVRLVFDCVNCPKQPSDYRIIIPDSVNPWSLWGLIHDYIVDGGGAVPVDGIVDGGDA